MENSIQFSIIAFVILSLIISVVYGDSIQRSKRKHLIAAGFFLTAAFIHAAVIFIDICMKSN